MINYKIYGYHINNGWVKAVEVSEENTIPLALEYMAKLDRFAKYIIIEHNYENDSDFPYDIGNFDNTIKKHLSLSKFDRRRH